MVLRSRAVSSQLAVSAVRNVIRNLKTAGIGPGIHATPKGLRHGFGIHAVRSGVPLNLIQRWLGHASMTTTAIYLQAMGAEEHDIAVRMWTQAESKG